MDWPPYTSDTKYYLEINNKINKKSVQQNLRSQYVNFWNVVYKSLPQVANITQTMELLRS